MNQGHSFRSRDIGAAHFVMNDDDEQRQIGLLSVVERFRAFCLTRNPPIGGARENVTKLNFTISADIQSNSLSSLVILRQTVTELCASFLAAVVLRTFVQYLIAFLIRHVCGRLSMKSM